MKRGSIMALFLATGLVWGTVELPVWGQEPVGGEPAAQQERADFDWGWLGLLGLIGLAGLAGRGRNEQRTVPTAATTTARH